MLILKKNMHNSLHFKQLMIEMCILSWDMCGS